MEGTDQGLDTEGMDYAERAILDEYLGDIKGMALSLITADLASGSPTHEDTSFYVARARRYVNEVNREIGFIAKATLTERERRTLLLEGEGESQGTG